MSSDIGQDILKSVRTDLASALDDQSGRLGRLFRKIQDGSATMSDVSTFSVLIGQTVSSAVEKRITPDVLPDGTLYFNIAQTILQGVLRDSHELINLAAQSVQERLDAQQGLHIKPVKPDFPEERIRDIAGAASTASMNKNEEKEERRLTSPVENVVQSFYSDYVRENADLRSKAGLNAYIIRRTSGRCCPWCSDLAGRYRYEDAPSDIYARHDNCTCTVDFVTNNYRQDVWSKRKYSLSKAERQAILDGTPKPTRYTREQAKNLQYSVMNRVANAGNGGIIELTGYYAGIGDKFSEFKAKVKALATPEKYKPVSAEYLSSLPRIQNSETIEQSLELTNPNGYTDNCQRCVPAYEMRRRGYAVIASDAPKNALDDNIGLYDYKKVFVGAEWKTCEGTGKDEIVEFMKTCGDGARVEIAIKTKNFAHVFIAEKTADTTLFIDPQRNIEHVERYFDSVILGTTEFCRIDNLEFSNLITDCIEVK